jgi:hypothetical protein
MCLISKNTYFCAQFELLDSLLHVINLNQRLFYYESFSGEEGPDSMARSLMQIDLQDEGNYVSIRKVYDELLTLD